jgi:hypothetical protein
MAEMWVEEYRRPCYCRMHTGPLANCPVAALEISVPTTSSSYNYYSIRYLLLPILVQYAVPTKVVNARCEGKPMSRLTHFSDNDHRTTSIFMASKCLD